MAKNQTETDFDFILILQPKTLLLKAKFFVCMELASTLQNILKYDDIVDLVSNTTLVTMF